MKKKIISLLLVIFFCFSWVSSIVFASSVVVSFFVNWAIAEATGYARNFISTTIEDSYKEKYSYLNCLRLFFKDSGLDRELVGEIIALLATQGLSSEQYDFLKSLCGNISDFDDFYVVYAPLCQSLYIKHNFYASAICDYIYSGNGAEAGVQAAFDSFNNPIVSADSFKEELIAQNYLYTPKSSGIFKFGYRSEKYLARIGGGLSASLRFYNHDLGFCEQGYTDLWFVPYLITYDGELMLDRYQYHIYFDDWIPSSTDSVSDINRYHYCIRVDIFSYVNGLGGVFENTEVLYKYGEIDDMPRYILYDTDLNCNVAAVFRYTDDLSSYVSGYSSGSISVGHPSSRYYYSSDFSRGVSCFDRDYLIDFSKPYSEMSSDIIDVGLLCSGSQIQFQYDIDIDRLPSNSTITISGDSVYDYSITDNSTGDTTTINEYVTNNYTYPAVDTSGNVGSGGKVDVEGKVEVGGKVDVNVDVNIVGAAAGIGSTLNPPDLDFDPINGYLDDALDESSGIRNFFKAFFDFLPPEILTLLGIGLAAVIVARILGR